MWSHVLRELLESEEIQTGTFAGLAPAEPPFRASGADAERSNEVDDALSELAFWAIGSDGDITHEEEALLRSWWTTLHGRDDYGSRFDAYNLRKKNEGRASRLDAITATLAAPAFRRLGYAIVFTFNNVDLARSPREERFENQLSRSFGLSEGEVAELENLVMSKLNRK